jgi:hypothetical protein
MHWWYKRLEERARRWRRWQRQWRLGGAASREEGRRRLFIGELRGGCGFSCTPRRRLGQYKSRYGQVTRPRRAWAPASTAARPLVGRRGGSTQRARVGKAGRCSQVVGVHGARTGGPRPVPAGRGTAAGQGAVRGTTRDVARVSANAWRRRTVPLDLTWFKCV